MVRRNLTNANLSLDEGDTEGGRESEGGEKVNATDINTEEEKKTPRILNRRVSLSLSLSCRTVRV